MTYLQEAQAIAEQLQVPPENNRRGYALLKLGRFEEAIATYDKVLEFYPDDANAFYYGRS